MQPFQQRVLQEKLELDVRLDALRAFVGSSPLFLTLPELEQWRMLKQFHHMAQYSAVLQERIDAF